MEPVDATDYRDIVQVGDPQLSPDGDRVAFVRKEPDGDDEYETTVYVVDADGGSEPRRFTAAEGADSQPRWSPDGDRLAFVSAARGEEDPSPQLWLLPVDGGEAERVTDVAGGASGPQWSPDGSKIVFTQATTVEEREEGHDVEADEEYEREDPDPRVVDRHVYRQGASYIDGTRSHVYVLDVESGEVERLTDGDRDHVGAEFGDASTVYYGVKRGEDPDDSYEYDFDAHDLATGESETMFTTTGWPMIAATADGRVAYSYRPEERITMRQTEIKVYDRETGDTVTVTENVDRTAGEFEWGPREELLYFTTPDEGDVTVRRVPGDASADPETLLEDGHVTGISTAGDAVALTKSQWDHRGDVFAADLDGGNERRLTEVNAEYVAEHAVQEPEEVWFESEDGVEIQGWVLTPPDFDESETYPLAVEIHGGPHAMWSTAGTMWHEFQTLASEGYVVFWSNPRGSIGYGEEHTTAIHRNWGDVTMTDVMAGVETVADRPYVDEENAFVTGGSFGGYMTGWIVGHTDYFSGAVAQRGVYDLASFYGSTDAFKLVEGDFDATPWEDPALLWEHSPVAYAHEVETPTLVVHSDNDFRVPVNNGEMFYLFMRKNGVDTRLVRYPREGHELSRSGEPAHVVDRVERIVRWFDGYSDHADVPPALEREPHEGLSAADAGEEDDGEEDPSGDESEDANDGESEDE